MKEKVAIIICCFIFISDAYASSEEEDTSTGVGSYITSSIVEKLGLLFGSSDDESETYSATPTFPSVEYSGNDGSNNMYEDSGSDFSFITEDNTSSLLGADYVLSDYSSELYTTSGGQQYILYTGGTYQSGDILTIGGVQVQLLSQSAYQQQTGYDEYLDFGSDYLIMVDMNGKVIPQLGDTPGIFKMPLSGGEYFFLILILGYGGFIYYRYKHKKVMI